MGLDLVTIPSANLWDRADDPDLDPITVDIPAGDLGRPRGDSPSVGRR